MPLDSPHTNELRGMVREILREAMVCRTAATGSAESVIIANDNDLAAFVRLLIARLDSPATAAAIRNGQHRFTLGGTAISAVAAASNAVVDGVVTENRIEKLAGTGTVVLAPGAILTPLARDRARRLGLKIERSR